MAVPQDKRIEEIPFDIAIWGDREVAPLRPYDPKEKPPGFRQLLERAERLERERLNYE